MTAVGIAKMNVNGIKGPQVPAQDAGIVGLLLLKDAMETAEGKPNAGSNASTSLPPTPTAPYAPGLITEQWSGDQGMEMANRYDKSVAVTGTSSSDMYPMIMPQRTGAVNVHYMPVTRAPVGSIQQQLGPIYTYHAPVPVVQSGFPSNLHGGAPHPSYWAVPLCAPLDGQQAYMPVGGPPPQIMGAADGHVPQRYAQSRGDGEKLGVESQLVTGRENMGYQKGKRREGAEAHAADGKPLAVIPRPIPRRTNVAPPGDKGEPGSETTKSGKGEASSTTKARRMRGRSMAPDGFFPCAECPMKFRRKDSMRRHIEGVHKKMRRFVCPSCNKDFKRRDHLKVHLYYSKKSVKCRMKMGIPEPGIPI